MDTAYDPQVIKGAEVLDRYFPKGLWRSDIDLDNLVMDNAERCVLGQLFGSYTDGLRKVFGYMPHTEKRYECGFSADPGDYEAFEKLDYEWRRYIEGTRG